MATILQPGQKAPIFFLPAANSLAQISLEQYRGQRILIIFFPANIEQNLINSLTAYEERRQAFGEQETIILGLSTAPAGMLKKLAAEKNIRFPLLSDSNQTGAVAGRYGILITHQQILPTVFVVDEDGLIRRVYESTQDPGLPNPAVVLRAIKKLVNTPKPPPITPDDWQLGPANAPVTIIEYADYQCAPCGETYRLLKQIIPAYGNKILWVHRHLPLRHSHPLAQQAAEAAGAQGKFWEMHDRLFEARMALEREHLLEYARAIGLNVKQFIQDLDDRRFKDVVNAEFKQAVRNKIKLPPALFINHLPLEGPRTKTVICKRIESLLAHDNPASLSNGGHPTI